jgi:hypothetical protein
LMWFGYSYLCLYIIGVVLNLPVAITLEFASDVNNLILE